MKKLIIVLGILAIATAAGAKMDAAIPQMGAPSAGRDIVEFYHEDHESGSPGWYSVDESVSPPRWHIDTYLAYDVNSWWCGELNAGFVSGDGYGNSWTEWLSIPTIDLSGATYAILTFKGRYDSEFNYDFTYVQAESSGAYVSLNTGYNGSSGGWFDIGSYGFPLIYDNPANIRFLFESDIAWSDEDGLYDSDGGACHLDDILIFDYYDPGTPLFFDDAETGGVCVPGAPGVPAGDFWHIVTDLCSSSSPPNSWWCGDDADSSLIPPNLQDVLYSPVVAITGAATCTLYHWLHAAVPGPLGDGWICNISADGGVSWTQLHAYYGDFLGCGGWGSAANGQDISDMLTGGAMQFQYKIKMLTDIDGCGPGGASATAAAGVNLDNLYLRGEAGVPVENSTWGRVKAMYR